MESFITLNEFANFLIRSTISCKTIAVISIDWFDEVAHKDATAKKEKLIQLQVKDYTHR